MTTDITSVLMPFFKNSLNDNRSFSVVLKSNSTLFRLYVQIDLKMHVIR